MKKLFDTWTFDSYMTVIKNRVREKYKKFETSWLGKVVAGWDHVRKLNAFKEHYLAWSDTIVSRWNFCAGNEIFSFAFLLFLWDNASQKLRIPSHFAKCELLIRTFLWIEFVFHFFFYVFVFYWDMPLLNFCPVH